MIKIFNWNKTWRDLFIILQLLMKTYFAIIPQLLMITYFAINTSISYEVRILL